MIYDMVAVRNVACVWTLGAMSYLVGPGSGEWKVTRARIMKLNLSAKNSGRSSFGAGRRYSWADTSPFFYVAPRLRRTRLSLYELEEISAELAR